MGRQHTLDVKRFKALGQPTRLELISLIAQHEGNLSVCGLASALQARNHPVSQPTLSHHLRILIDAGLIDVMHQGLENYYYLLDETFYAAIETIRAIARIERGGQEAAS